MFTYYYSPIFGKVRRFSKNVAQHLSVSGRWCLSTWSEIDVINTTYIKLK